MRPNSGGLKRAANVSEAAMRNAPLILLPRAFPHEGKNEGKAGMFPESREGPSTAGGKPPRSRAVSLLLCEVNALREDVRGDTDMSRLMHRGDHLPGIRKSLWTKDHRGPTHSRSAKLWLRYLPFL